jgi:hypothetical protein
MKYFAAENMAGFNFRNDKPIVELPHPLTVCVGMCR